MGVSTTETRGFLAKTIEPPLKRGYIGAMRIQAGILAGCLVAGSAMTVGIAAYGSGWGKFRMGHQGLLSIDDLSWEYAQVYLEHEDSTTCTDPPPESVRGWIVRFICLIYNEPSGHISVTYLAGPLCDWVIVPHPPTSILRPLYDDPARGAMTFSFNQTTQHRSGWPFRIHVSEHEAIRQDRGSLVVDLTHHLYNEPRSIPIDWKIRMPTRVLWMGLFANIFIFTACSFVPLSLCLMGWRAWRKHRGRCPLCNYILFENLVPGCPECGWSRPAGEGEPPVPPAPTASDEAGPTTSIKELANDAKI